MITKISLIIFLFICGNAMAQTTPLTNSVKFQYKIDDVTEGSLLPNIVEQTSNVSPEPIVKKIGRIIDKRSAEGWELVTLNQFVYKELYNTAQGQYPYTFHIVLTFKRELNFEQQQQKAK